MTLQRTLFRNGTLLLIAAAGLIATPVAAERIKDLTSISGVRLNQLIGYGLVVGLNGTGDKDTDSPAASHGERSEGW